MPPSNAQRPAGQAQAQDEEQQGSTFKSVMQSIAIFMFVQWLMGQILNKNAPGKGPSTVPGSIPPFSQKPDQISITNGTAVPFNAAPIWPEDSHLDLSIYVSSSPKLDSFGTAAKEAVKVLDERDFVIGDFNENREANSVFKVPAPAQNNGTLWAHFFVALAGHQLDPSAREYSTETAYYFSHPLTEYLPKKKAPKLKNLLSSNATEELAEEKKEEKEAAKKPLIAPYYHPNVTVSIIPDSGVLNLRAMNPAMRKHVQLEATGARDASGYHGWYYPIVFLNKFWQLKTHMVEVNSTVEELPIYITLNNQKNWKFSILASMDESMKQAAQQKASGQSIGGGDGSEFEMFKEILLDTNVYLLATTGVVSVLHMIFETLAFKSDIVSTGSISS
ncbi:hypothetical protein KEM55_003065 [Ascosphaera atra]|nr:hypothetical protein KEM55_003065 [Ascosphaera atra]